ncbi:hypothetical protein BH24ACT2_BH24ACT2_00200 [soil metagenome]
MAQPHLSSFVPTAKDLSGWSPQSEVFNRLLQDRTILLGSEIDDVVSSGKAGDQYPKVLGSSPRPPTTRRGPER